MKEATVQLVLSGLAELSCIDEQKRLWLSDGADGKEVSSPVEAVERLFSDSALDEELRSGGTGLSAETIALLKRLEELTTGVDLCRERTELINSAAMDDVRRLALSVRIACEKEMTTGKC